MKQRLRLCLLAGFATLLGALAPTALQAMYPCDFCVLRYNSCVSQGGTDCQAQYELCLSRCEP
jgi:hypothetical protein